MKILVINAGSSSLKYQLINMEDESVIAKGNCDRIGIDGHIKHTTFDGRTVEADCKFPTHTEAFEKLVEVLTTGEGKVIDSMSEISAVGHRIVQGAEIFSKTTLVTDEVIQQIDDLAELAPVHNHPHALALRACKKVIPATTPQVVVFDTAFHSTMPEKAFMYGLPYECYEKLHVRKYGFHGTSHRFVSQALADAMGKDIKDLKIVSCHLGNGSSISAVKDGKCFDTTMGLTPLEGIIMGTRCGSIDPAIVTTVMAARNLSPAEMDTLMNKKSGMLGIAGTSDNRTIEGLAKNGDKKAQLVENMLCHQLVKYIGGFAAAMGGVDAVVFTGGIGENNPHYRTRVAEKLAFLGTAIDEEKNSVRGEEIEISVPGSKVKLLVIPTNEELMIAKDTLEIVSAL